MNKILFIGDSITDTYRNKGKDNWDSVGYGLMAASFLLSKKNGQYEFLNQGVFGNSLADIYAAIKADCWNDAPDIISILVGANDAWNDLCSDSVEDAECFEDIYQKIISEILKKKADTRFILMEPFALKSAATEENWVVFENKIKKRAEATRQLAEQNGAVFVPLQSVLNQAADKTGTEYWLSDGIRPTIACHYLIANEWLKQFNFMEEAGEKQYLSNRIQRYGSTIKLKPDKIEEYIKWHKNPLPGVNEMIKKCNLQNYSIYQRGDVLFSYYEYTGENYEKDMEKMAQDTRTQEWWSIVKPLMQPLEDRKAGEFWSEMEEVYHLN